jgi:hypothetical protein
VRADAALLDVLADAGLPAVDPVPPAAHAGHLGAERFGNLDGEGADTA